MEKGGRRRACHACAVGTREAREGRNGMEFVPPFFKCAQLGDSFSSISQFPKHARRTRGRMGWMDLRQKSHPAQKHLSALGCRLSSPRTALSVALWSAADGEIFNPYPTRTDFNCIPCRTPLETRRSPMSVQPLLFPKSMSSSLHKSAALARPP